MLCGCSLLPTLDPPPHWTGWAAQGLFFKKKIKKNTNIPPEPGLGGGGEGPHE